MADMANLLDYSEALTRAEFGAFPDGAWDFEDFLDDDGFSEDPIRIAARVIKQGTDITVDFTGTSRQVKGSINLPIAMTQSSVYACLRSVVGPQCSHQFRLHAADPCDRGARAPSSILSRPPRWRRAG
jgi:N-methylhydantoinase B